MKVSTPKSGSAIIFIITASLSFGIAVGVVKTLRLGLAQGGLAIAAIMLIQWLIFRSGRSSSYASAQAWAQANVDVAVEVTNILQAEAKALSVAYSLAISNANATAQNQVSIQLPGGSVLPLISQEDRDSSKQISQEVFLGQMSDFSEVLRQVQLTKGVEIEARDEERSPMAVGEFNPQESSALRQGSDS